MTQIDILYFDGCPNHQPTTELVCDVVRTLGVDAKIRQVEVCDPNDVARLRFFGSPTVQVNGLDVDPGVRGRVDYSFSCRMYGRSGSPPRSLIETALRECGPLSSAGVALGGAGYSRLFQCVCRWWRSGT